MTKSKLLAVLLACTLAFSCVFVACDGGKTPPEPTTYTVTFNLNGAPGTAPTAQTIEEGKKASKPTDPSWTDYDFGGWYTEAAGTTKWEFDTNTVTKDITLYAKWTEKTPNVDPAEYTVTFNANGGKFADDKETMTAETVNGKVSAPATNPTRSEYKFVAWYQDKAKADAAAEDGKFDFNTALTAATTLYAGWEQNVVVEPSTEYTVTFNANGGAFTSGTTTNVESVNGKVTAPATNPTREGYTFVAWYQDKAKADAAAEDGKFDFNTALTAATTLYAGWKQNEVENPVAKVTVAFHAGEGLFEDGTDTYEIEVDENTVLDEDEIPRPEKTGYEFDWWYTDEDLTEEWDADEPITADLDLYAYYEVAERVIEFDVNKGTFPNVVNSTNITKLSGEKISQDDLIIAPTKYGYDFIGWCKDAEGKDLWDYDNDVVTDNMTLYAGWVKHDYGESPKFEGIQGKGLSYNGIYKGVIDGENVEFVCTKMKYADNDSNSDSTPEVLTYGSIVWEGHYIEIKSIGTSATIAIIDGVEVRITSPVYGRLKIEREGYADITLKTDDATGGLPMG